MERRIHELFVQATRVHRAGDLARAEALYREVIRLQPRHANAQFLLGSLDLEAGRAAQAVGRLERAIRVEPRNPAFHGYLGDALCQLGRWQEAAAAFRRQLALKPDQAEAYANLGRALEAMGHGAPARQAYERALRLKPDLAHVSFLLGRAAWTQGQPDEACDAFRAGLVHDPDNAALHNGLGVALKDLGRLDDAVQHFRRAVEIDPSAREAHSNLVYALSFHPEYDDGAIAAEARRWAAAHAAPSAGEARPGVTEAHPDPARRLRVGYLGPTLRDHIIGRLLVPVLEAHDRERFEIVCYADDPAFDAISARLRAASSRWESVVGLDDAQVRERVRGDRIDILVDVNMHMAKSRLGVFARRAAPLQMCWIAYPGTTGLSEMDYRISDVHLDPTPADEAALSECTLRLPDTFWCFDALGVRPPISPLPAAQRGFVTFGYLGNLCKVNRGTLALWARVLNRVGDARLVMLVQADSARRWVREELSLHGVAPERLAFVAYAPRERYLETYAEIDLGLDSFPYNGHTTSLDSFFMGVPVLTKRGYTVAGRAGACIAHNLGLPELVAADDEGFVAEACALAGDRARLAELRGSLRERMERSPLMDASRFARNLEALYRQAWTDACAAKGGSGGARSPVDGGQ